MIKIPSEKITILIDNAIRRIRDAKGRGWEGELERMKEEVLKLAKQEKEK